MSFEKLSNAPTLGGNRLQGKELGRGKDAVAYELGDDLVYRMGHENPFAADTQYRELFVDHARREVTAFAGLPAETRVSRTLIAWVDGGRVHKIVERAEGEPIHKTGEADRLIPVTEIRANWEQAIAVAASVPDEHYARLVQSEAELRKRHIYMDYLGMENLLYDPSAGFTIIDAEFEPQIPLKGKAMYTALVDIHSLEVLIFYNRSWQGKISPEARDAAVEVLQKLERAGHCPAYQLRYEMLCQSLGYLPPSAIITAVTV